MKTDIANRFIWYNGEILNVNDAKVNILSPTAQFGLNVFEGIRCYWNKEKRQLYAFRLEDHFRRLQRSSSLLQISCSFSIEELMKAFIDTVRFNEYEEDIAVRQTVFVEGFGSWGSSEPVGMFIAPIPKSNTSVEYNKNGLNCCVSTWRRISECALSPRIKCGANYINSRMAQGEAIRHGYDTTILLNDMGKVAEGPGSCFFMVRNGVLITPQITDSILESITRDTVIKIAESMGIEVRERSIDRTEIYIADEAFLCGSAMEITPIYSIDRYMINGGKMGEITSKIYEKYLKIVIGADEEYEDWITGIY